MVFRPTRSVASRAITTVCAVSTILDTTVPDDRLTDGAFIIIEPAIAKREMSMVLMSIGSLNTRVR